MVDSQSYLDVLADLDETSFSIDELEISALCCDEEFVGFDKNNGNTWIYPTNYPIRDYQYNIVNAALFKNTLVSLPTGLGKTFIAAVVMYNYYRWYPLGKIIFVAPTRPLVAQQIQACYNITAIPPEHTVEMTGTMSVQSRKSVWRDKRVIFATPQVIQNDLESGSCPGELIRCIVIDEAHRAKGRHAYCRVVELLSIKRHNLYRVLALSATPGSKVDDVIQVVKNLNISHLELRTEQCLDVSMYSHVKNIKTVVIPLGDDLNAVRNQFIEILDIYTRRLVQCKVLTGNIGTLSKGKIIMLFKEYQSRERAQRHPQHKYIMLDFTMIITLYHALELLTRHGTRVFLNFFDEHPDKTWIGKDDRLVSFLERLRDDLGINPMSIDRSILPDGSIPNIKENIIYGHPKFDHLRNIILDHFNTAKYKGEETKAIIFCEYRESVNLVHCLLLQCRPLIKPQMFVGQGSGKDGNMKALSQKQQLKIMHLFRQGLCNVLISTCVGEEGLDVGNVDLIICFDISNKSPVRLVQRCGRTGRERNGRVVILVTEGREHQILKDCMYERDSLNKRILQSKELKKSLYSNCPRMLPSNVKPICQKMFITVQKTNTEQKETSNIKNIFYKTMKNHEKEIESSILSEDKFIELFNGKYNVSESITVGHDYWNMSKNDISNLSNNDNDENKNIYSKYIEWQRNLQYTNRIKHSLDSIVLCELLQYADTKRYNPNLAVSLSHEKDSAYLQSNVKEKSRIVKAKSNISKNMDKLITCQKSKTNDIRQLFKKINRINNKTEALFDDKREEILKECGINVDSKDNYVQSNSIPKIFLDFVVEYDIESSKLAKLYEFNRPPLNLIQMSKFNFPSAIMSDYVIPDVLNISSLSCFDFDVLLKLNTRFSMKFHEGIEISHNNHYLDGSQDDQIDSLANVNNVSAIANNINGNQTKNNFDMIDIETIFNSSDISQNEQKFKDHNDEIYNPLNFFGLRNIEEIFDDDSFDKVSGLKRISPDRFKDEHNNDIDQDSLSPIILTQKSRNRKRSVINACDLSNFSDSFALNRPSKNQDRSMLTITQALNAINASKNQINDVEIKESFKGNSNHDAIIENDDDNHSVIFSSQINTTKMTRFTKFHNQIIKHIVIPASSESSDDSIDEINSCNHSHVIIDSEDTNIDEHSEADSDSSSIKVSPFFNTSNLQINSSSRKPKIDEIDNRTVIDDRSIIFNRYSQIQKSKFTHEPIIISNKDKENNFNDSDDDFVKKPSWKFSFNNQEKQIEKKIIRKSKKDIRKKKRCDFIDYEAILSDDSYLGGSSENEDCSDDSNSSLKEFICDEKNGTHNESVDITAKYLQSVKSPLNVGQFKIPKLPTEHNNICSQDVDADVSYEMDSFCVGNEHGLTQVHELSELEIAEEILERRKRKKCYRKIFDESDSPINNDTSLEDSCERHTKRIRMRINSDSESD